METLTICKYCSGTGELTNEFGVGRDYDSITYECGFCNGSGRVKHLNMEVTIPFGFPSNEITTKFREIFDKCDSENRKRSRENLKQTILDKDDNYFSHSKEFILKEWKLND